MVSLADEWYLQPRSSPTRTTIPFSPRHPIMGVDDHVRVDTNVRAIEGSYERPGQPSHFPTSAQPFGRAGFGSTTDSHQPSRSGESTPSKHGKAARIVPKWSPGERRRHKDGG